MLNRNRQSRLSEGLCVLCIAALLAPIVAIAQQQATSTQKLREQIALMEAVDKDSDTSDEVRALNRTLLAERRTQLSTRLVKEIEALKKYEQTVAASLTTSEKQKISNLLSSLKQELESLKNESAVLEHTPSETTPALALQPTQSEDAKTSGLREAESPLNNSVKASLSNHPLPAHSAAESTANALLVAACYQDAPQNLVNTARAAAQQFLRGDDPGSQFNSLVYFAITHTVAIDTGHENLLKAIEVKQLQEQTRRTDKQIGAPASAAGSTTVAEKPNFAEILGFAVDHGAIQQAINGTTLNLSTTPYALFAALNGGDTQSNYKQHGHLTRLGISADFNIQNPDALLTNARRSQLADWSLRLRLSKDRSTRSDDAEEIWNSISSQFAQPNLVITDMLKATFQSDVELEAQRRELSDRIPALTAEASVKAVRDDTTLTNNQKIDQIAEKIICRVKTDIVDRMRAGVFNISNDSKDRIIRVTLPAYAVALQARETALQDFDKRIEALSNEPIFSVAYINVRPAMGTNYSELKMLYQKKTGNPMSIIANGGLSLYHKPNRANGQQTVRDFVAALSFEGTAGRSPFLLETKDESQITYSFTGRYQRLLQNRLIPGRKADIAVAQFKLNVPMLAGASFPFSITYANASELIKEKHMRANFGFSFDADKLLKALALSKLPSP